MNREKNELIKIVIVGAGSFGKEVLWTLNDCNEKTKKYEILGFIDDNTSMHGKFVDEIPVIGGFDWFSTESATDVKCVVAIGDPKIRQKIANILEMKKVVFTSVIHPSVIYSKFVNVGTDVIIQAGSIITTDVTIGNHTHINLDCTIGHDCIIGDFVTLSPGVHVSGKNIIEAGTFIGTGAVTNEKLRIGKGSVIGAGTVLIENVPEFSLYVGVPGKMKKKIN